MVSIFRTAADTFRKGLLKNRVALLSDDGTGIGKSGKSITLELLYLVCNSWKKGHEGAIANIIAPIHRGSPSVVHTGAARTAEWCIEHAASSVRINYTIPVIMPAIIKLHSEVNDNFEFGVTHGMKPTAQRLFTRNSKMSAPKKVSIIGSGNWGSAIAKIVGLNVQTFDWFDKNVKMYVYEEIINGSKLTEIINTQHENVKYLPGHKIPPNVVAVPDVVEATKDADILIFVVPHQFIKRLLQQMQGKIKPTAIAISLIKGVDYGESGIELISRVIGKALNIEVNVLMGANLAPEVADEKFCETTIGAHSKESGKLLKDLIQTNYFRVVVVDDVETVEICGALKNIVACGAGFVDGLGLGDNTKAAVIRLGLMEMIKFAEIFCNNSQLSTFFESCGVADLITTCYGGRNRRVSEAFVKTGKSIEQLEEEMLNGQKLQGPETAVEVNAMLKTKGFEDKFPLFTAIHLICKGEIPASQMVDCIRNHPEHIYSKL